MPATDVDHYGRTDGDLNHAGAVWCDTHHRWECDHVRADDTRCHASAIKNWYRCKTHSGMTVAKARARGYANITAFNARAIEAVKGGHPPVDPGQAVMGMLAMSWERVHFYAWELDEQITRESSLVQSALDGTTDGPSSDAGTNPLPVRRGVGTAASGLIGHMYSGVKDIGIFASGEQIRGLVDLEQTERDRCVKYAKVAHDMGIEQRYVELAERQGEALVSMLRAVLGRLGLSEVQQAASGAIVAEELGRLREITAHPDTLTRELADGGGSE